MLRTEIPQLKVIHAESPTEFESVFNAEMRKLAQSGVRCSVDYDFARLTAFVHYSVDFTQPQSLADRYELGGERHYCGECPHLQRVADKRVKRLDCELDEERWHTTDEPACEIFYREMERRGKH